MLTLFVGSCDDSIKLGEFVQDSGTSYQVLTAFGELIQTSPNRVAHYLEIQLTPASASIFAPTTGEITYQDDLGGLPTCVVIKPKLRDDKGATPLEKLGPGLADAEDIQIALCNLDNSGGPSPLHTAIQTLYTDANDPDPGDKATRFLNIALAPKDRRGNVWAAPEAVMPDPPAGGDKKRWSRLGPAAGGKLQIVVFQVKDGNTTYLNPAPYLAKIPMSPGTSALRPPKIAEIKVQTATDEAFAEDLKTFDVDLATGAITPNERLEGFFRVFFRLTNIADDGDLTPLVVPQEVSYSIGRSSGSSLDIKSSAFVYLNSLATSPAIDLNSISGAFADKLYRTSGEPGTISEPSADHLWLQLNFDPTVPDGSGETPKRDIGSGSTVPKIDLDSAPNGVRQFPIGDYELDIVLASGFGVATSDSRKVLFNITGPIEVDLDIDTNMDGVVDASDDPLEWNAKAIVINVNNDDSDGDGTPDSHDGAINGSSDKSQLTDLWLRQVPDLPAGGKVELTVSSAHPGPTPGDPKEWLRIFDDTDTGVIGPPAADGGPGTSTHVVPNAKITAGDLHYRIEGFGHGTVVLELITYDSTNSVLGLDQVRAVMNVDRLPDGRIPRFHVQGDKDLQTETIEGMRATIESPMAKVNYAPQLRTQASTNIWIGPVLDVSANDIRWIQAGITVERREVDPPANVVSGIYFESRAGPGDANYHMRIKPVPWPENPMVFEVRIVDPSTGRIAGFADGVEFDHWEHQVWKTRKLHHYQASTELFHSVDQMPGTVASHSKISDIEVLVNGAWQPGNFSAADLRLIEEDKNGAKIFPTDSHEWAVSVGASGDIEIWDYSIEY